MTANLRKPLPGSPLPLPPAQVHTVCLVDMMAATAAAVAVAVVEAVAAVVAAAVAVVEVVK